MKANSDHLTLSAVFWALSSVLVTQNCTAAELLKEPLSQSHLEVYAGLLYLQPEANNLVYAVNVAGNQPYQQSWHNQKILPGYSPSFDVGLNYIFHDNSYSASLDWTHLTTSDQSAKQAPENVDLATVSFVAPPYEVGPPVFGVKRADSTVNFYFDTIYANANKLFEYNSDLRANVFGGVNILRINQTLSTTFSDFAGALPTPYSYALPADPTYSFQSVNKSHYIGAGPDLGFDVQYNVYHGWGIVGQMLGTITAGSEGGNDTFTGISNRLTLLGLSPNQQIMTTPDATQIVPGFDAKLGLVYQYTGSLIPHLTIEAGYRVAYYSDAIMVVRPNSLVQPGTVTVTPEFATGTLAIQSTDTHTTSFNVNGPYVNFKFTIA